MLQEKYNLRANSSPNTFGHPQIRITPDVPQMGKFYIEENMFFVANVSHSGKGLCRRCKCTTVIHLFNDSNPANVKLYISLWNLSLILNFFPWMSELWYNVYQRQLQKVFGLRPTHLLVYSIYVCLLLNIYVRFCSIYAALLWTTKIIKKL